MNSLLKKLLLLITVLFFPFMMNGQDWVSKMQNPNVNFFEVQTTFYEYYNDYVATYRQQNGTDPVRVPGYKQFKRWEHFMAQRVSADGTRLIPLMHGKKAKSIVSRWVLLMQETGRSWGRKQYQPEAEVQGA